jgi:hypothetical protein
VRPIPPAPCSEEPQLLGPAPDDTEDDPGAGLTRSPHDAADSQPPDGASQHVILAGEPEPAWRDPGAVDVVGPKPKRRRRSRRKRPADAAAGPTAAERAPKRGRGGRRPQRRRGAARPAAASGESPGEPAKTPSRRRKARHRQRRQR